MAEEPHRKKIRSSSVTTVISISLVLFLLGLLGLLFISAKKISDHLKENIGFHVYLKDNSNEEDVEKLHSFLQASSYVKSSKYISKEEAAEIYKQEVGEDFVQFIGYNPLPSSFEVQLKADYAIKDSIAWIKEQIMDNKIAKEFDYQESLVNMVNDNVRKIAIVLLIFIGLLMLIALALINNTIRLAIYSRRFLIKTMLLVGATNRFVRKPFLLSGIRHGIVAGIIANLMLGGIIFAVMKKVPDLAQVSDTKMIIGLFGIVLLFGIIISGISTFFAVRKYLRVSADELYY